MNSILNRNIYLVKEHVGMFKASNNFDVFNPDNGSLLMTCREPNLGFFTKLFRFTDYKRMTPFHIVIADNQGKKIISIKRGFTIFRSDVEIFNESDKLIGVFKQKFFSFAGKFDIHDANDRYLCSLQGKWTGWDFKFTKDAKNRITVEMKTEISDIKVHYTFDNSFPDNFYPAYSNLKILKMVMKIVALPLV